MVKPGFYTFKLPGTDCLRSAFDNQKVQAACRRILDHIAKHPNARKLRILGSLNL